MALKIKGSTSGSVELNVPAAVSGGDVSLTLPNGTGSANQFLKNGSAAGTLEYSSLIEDGSGNISAGGTVTTGGTINAANTSAAGNAIVIGNSNQIVLEANGSSTFAGAVTSTTTAKAWVNFSGTGTVVIRGNHNVASITDNGTGNYTVNFTNALANTNYAVSGLNDYAIAASTPTTTSTFKVITFNPTNGALTDFANNYLVFFGT